MNIFYQGLEYFATIVEGVVFLSAVTLLSGKRFGGKRLYLAIGGFTVLYTVLISALNSWEAFSFVTISVTIVFVLLATKLTSSGNLLLRCTATLLCIFFITGLDYIFGYSSAMLIGGSVDIYKGFEIIMQPGRTRMIYIFINKAVQIAVFLLCLPLYPRLKRLEKRPLVFLFFVSAVFFIVLQLMTGLIMNQSMTVMQVAVILSTVFIVLAMIAVIVAFGVNSRYQEKKRQSELMQVTNRMLEKNYADMQAREGTIRRQMHDFKNHLRAIGGLVKGNEEAEKYIDELLQTSYAQARGCRCGNSVIDAIINCKLAEAQERGITMNYHISVENPLPVAAVDLCAILSNQLDNAIEACEKTAAERRRIDVEILQRNKLVYFKVVNDAPDDPFDEKHRLRTSKDNADGLHGLGIANILDAARRNGGELKNEYKDGKFYSTAMISLEN